MAFSILLEIGLIVSIAGIIALSLFILYLVDKLQTKVNSLERISKEMSNLKDEVSTLLAEKSKSESLGQASSSLHGEITGIPNGRGKEIPAIQKLVADIQTLDQKIETLTNQIQSNSYKTNDLRSDIQETRKAIENLTKTVADSSQKLNVHQTDLSKLDRKLKELEETITTIIRNSLQAKP